MNSPVAWHSDHLTIGRRYVQMFSLKTTPEASRPCLFSGLTTLDCDSILCSTWRPKSTTAARSEIDAQEKFISFFKVGVLTRVMSGHDTASLETGAGARAANNQVDDLGEVIRSLDKKAQGEYSLRFLVAARSVDELRGLAPAVHRVFVDARARSWKKRLATCRPSTPCFPATTSSMSFPCGLRRTTMPGCRPYSLRNLGHPYSEDLDNEYLNIFETRTRTPFFQDVYVDGVRVMLILGPTGPANPCTAMASARAEIRWLHLHLRYRRQLREHGRAVRREGGPDRPGRPRVNPFALEPTEKNIKFLYNFVKLLVANGGAELGPEDDDVIFKEVQNMYLLDGKSPAFQSLPAKKTPALSREMGWHRRLSPNFRQRRRQPFAHPMLRLPGCDNEQYADLIEPLMVWLLRRIDDVLYNPANLGVPKHVLIEEIFSSMKNKQLLDGALASIKTVRKNLGGVTMIGQSADDLGENADTIVNSCTSFLF